MTRRVIAAFAAVVLALIAGVMVAGYVAGADSRAAAGYELSDVLVVTETILLGESAVLGTNVELHQLPATAIVAGSVASVEMLSDRVASVELLPGEQLIDARFVNANLAMGKVVDIPEHLAEVTIPLSSERVIGGNVLAGDTVGVLANYETASGSTTSTLMHRALVSRVQGITISEEVGGEPVASDGIQVTLAISARDVQRVVFAAEFGSLWLTLEQETTDISDTTPITVTELDQ
ncbi:Flp pilus assembly protein CpaB [Tessaracoccus sp.]